MLHLRLDVKKRLDVCALDERCDRVADTAAWPDADGLRNLVRDLAPFGAPVHSVIESMTGAASSTTSWSCTAGTSTSPMPRS
jgi:hypothetical protein